MKTVMYAQKVFKSSFLNMKAWTHKVIFQMEDTPSSTTPTHLSFLWVYSQNTSCFPANKQENGRDTRPPSRSRSPPLSSRYAYVSLSSHPFLTISCLVGRSFQPPLQQKKQKEGMATFSLWRERKAWGMQNTIFKAAETKKQKLSASETKKVKKVFLHFCGACRGTTR